MNILAKNLLLGDKVSLYFSLLVVQISLIWEKSLRLALRQELAFKEKLANTHNLG